MKTHRMTYTSSIGIGQPCMEHKRKKPLRTGPARWLVLGAVIIGLTAGCAETQSLRRPPLPAMQVPASEGYGWRFVRFRMDRPAEQTRWERDLLIAHRVVGPETPRSVVLVLAILIEPFMIAIIGIPTLIFFTAAHGLHISIQTNILQMWGARRSINGSSSKRGIGRRRTLPVRQDRIKPEKRKLKVTEKQPETDPEIQNMVPKQQIEEGDEEHMKPRVLAPPPGYS